MENYNTDYVCSYKNLDEHKDVIEEYGNDFIEDLLYKRDILYIFNLDEYKDDVIFKSMENIYKIVKENEGIKICIQKIKELYPFITNDDISAFMILYSYDYLEASHPCICDIIKTGTISEEKLTKLHKLILLCNI
jgi:hypothetical protein